MNRDKIGTQTCYQLVVTLMYITCLCPSLVSVHFYAIPILHFKFPKFLFPCKVKAHAVSPAYMSPSTICISNLTLMCLATSKCAKNVHS